MLYKRVAVRRLPRFNDNSERNDMFDISKRAVFPAIAALLLLAGCASTKEDKYELKSPCVAAESVSDGANPCVRRPANRYHPYAVIPEKDVV